MRERKKSWGRGRKNGWQELEDKGKITNKEVVRGRGTRLRRMDKVGDRRTRGGSPLTPEHQPGEGVNRKEFLQLWVLVSVHLVMQAHWLSCDHDREGKGDNSTLIRKDGCHLHNR